MLIIVLRIFLFFLYEAVHTVGVFVVCFLPVALRLSLFTALHSSPAVKGLLYIQVLIVCTR